MMQIGQMGPSKLDISACDDKLKRLENKAPGRFQ